MEYARIEETPVLNMSLKIANALPETVNEPIPVKCGVDRALNFFSRCGARSVLFDKARAVLRTSMRSTTPRTDATTIPNSYPLAF